MTKKNDSASATTTDGLWESTNRIWLAGLAAFARAQEEGNKFFDTLVKEGESLQRSARHQADESPNELLGRAIRGWDQLGQVFENQVSETLHRLGVPTQRDIQALSLRIEELNRKLEELQK